MSWLKLWWLKRNLRSEFKRATGWMNDMDCGHHMATAINPDILVHERRFDEIADQLEAMGEDVGFRMRDRGWS